MNSFTVKPLTLAVLLASVSVTLQAEEKTAPADDNQTIEEVAVIGQRVSYANSSTNDVMQQSRSSLNNVMDMVNDLPGVKISQGDAFGSDDYSTTITMRGFTVSVMISSLASLLMAYRMAVRPMPAAAKPTVFWTGKIP